VRAHSALGQDGIPSIERLHNTGNTFTRTGGPAMRLIGVNHSLISDNRINSPIRATFIARPQSEMRRQAILLKQSRNVAVPANTLDNPESHTSPDPVSSSRLVGL
jgi:hypothetical protein